MSQGVFILGGKRTPMGEYVGALKDLSAIELGAIASRATLDTFNPAAKAFYIRQGYEVFGTLADIYGRRAMIIAALSLFVVGSILCAVAPNMPVLILARGLQGLGGGGIMPIVQTVISDVVSPRERGQYQAYFSGVWMAAGIGGPVLGGIFAEHLHW